jgi:hypothetical protein
MLRCQWLTPVIPATQEAEMRQIMVQSQPRKIVHQTQSAKNPSQKRDGKVVQGVGLECKPQYRGKKKSVECIKYSSLYTNFMINRSWKFWFMIVFLIPLLQSFILKIHLFCFYSTS